MARPTISTTLNPVPVTILTGLLGSGKTTFLNRILHGQHGRRIAVIESEFGEAEIDNDILVQNPEEQIVEMNNGCICCSVRGDLIRILGDLQSQRACGELHFDRIIIETTGLADPAPVAQTFFVNDEVHENFILDAIVTTVDATHAQQQLDEHHEAQEQVGFADRIFITKSDLVPISQIQTLRERLKRLNPCARTSLASQGEIDLANILDIRAFRPDATFDIEPDFLSDVSRTHDDSVRSLVFTESQPLSLDRLEAFFSKMLTKYGLQLMRYKGILHIANDPNQKVFQGVHMLISVSDWAPWGVRQPRQTKIVFIGKNLPSEELINGLRHCVTKHDVGI
jgi:G3E family GTPase